MLRHGPVAALAALAAFLHAADAIIIGAPASLAGSTPSLGLDGALSLASVRLGRRAFDFAVPTADQLMAHCLMRTGLWEPEQTRAMVEMIQPGDVVVDAGANIGTKTVPMAAAVGRDGLVLAFEPLRFQGDILSTNVAMNTLSDQVSLQRVALGGPDATAAAFGRILDLPESVVTVAARVADGMQQRAALGAAPVAVQATDEVQGAGPAAVKAAAAGADQGEEFWDTVREQVNRGLHLKANTSATVTRGGSFGAVNLGMFSIKGRAGHAGRASAGPGTPAAAISRRQARVPLATIDDYRLWENDPFEDEGLTAAGPGSEAWYPPPASMCPSVIKSDVEGLDAQLLFGAQRTLRLCRPTLFVEGGPSQELALPDGSVVPIGTWLNLQGYELYWQQVSGCPPLPAGRAKGLDRDTKEGLLADGLIDEAVAALATQDHRWEAMSRNRSQSLNKGRPLHGNTWLPTTPGLGANDSAKAPFDQLSRRRLSLTPAARASEDLEVAFAMSYVGTNFIAVPAECAAMYRRDVNKAAVGNARKALAEAQALWGSDGASSADDLPESATRLCRHAWKHKPFRKSVPVGNYSRHYLWPPFGSLTAVDPDIGFEASDYSNVVNPSSGLRGIHAIHHTGKSYISEGLLVSYTPHGTSDTNE